jgi:hypothetical protein
LVGSRVSQIETSLYPLDANIHAIEPVRHIGVLAFQVAYTLLHLTEIIPHIIDGATDVAQELQDHAIRLDHGNILSQEPSDGNARRSLEAPAAIARAP